MTTDASCAAPDQDAASETPVPPGATVIDGQVQRGGDPVAGAFVRLLDRGGEFVAEVVSGAQGRFRFHAAPGVWTVRALAPGVTGTRTVQAATGVNAVEVDLA